MSLEQSLTLERPGIFFELVKAQIMTLSCPIYCIQLQNASVDHHRLHSPPRHTALIIILVGSIGQVFQALLLVSTYDQFLIILNHLSVQCLIYTAVVCCCLHTLPTVYTKGSSSEGSSQLIRMMRSKMRCNEGPPEK